MFQQLKQEVDDALKQVIDTENIVDPSLQQAIQYAVLQGGKRLRPLLLLVTASLLGLKQSQAMPLACAVELIHCYSLVHDDLPCMDDDDLRRGKPTCHKVYGEAIALLAADYLQSLAYRLLLQSELPAPKLLEVLDVLTKAALHMVDGQAQDLAAEGRDIALETLEQLHAYKTGALIAACVHIPVCAMNVPLPQKNNLQQIATLLGLIYQIQDDILDIESTEDVLGKPIGSDINNNKSTYPRIMGLEQSKQYYQHLSNKVLALLAHVSSEKEGFYQLVLAMVNRMR